MKPVSQFGNYGAESRMSAIRINAADSSHSSADLFSLCQARAIRTNCNHLSFPHNAFELGERTALQIWLSGSRSEAVTRLNIDAYSSTIGTFYDAAYGVTSWSEAMRKLNQLMDGSRSWLFHCEPGHLNAHMSDYDEGFHSAEGQAAAMRDPLFDLYRARQAGTIVRHSELEDVSAFRKRELWQDWLRPRDMDFGLQCTLKKSGSDVFYLDLNRSMKRGDFTDDDMATAWSILPHVMRAGEIAAIVGGPRDHVAGPVRRQH